MTRSAPPSIAAAIGVLAALVAAPTAAAKVPPQTTYEACGRSGCKSATQEQVGFALMNPTFRPRVDAAPAGTRAWIRVEVGFWSVPGGPAARRALRPLERPFPVIFVPAAGYIGRVNRSGGYVWVRLRPREARAYEDLAGGVRPFPAQRLAELDPITVAKTKPDGATGDAEGRTGISAQAALAILALVATLSLGAAGLLLRGRLTRLRRGGSRHA